MELPLLTTEVKTHLQALFEGHVIGRRCRRRAFNPERRDAHRCGMPGEAGGVADRRFLEGLFQQFADCHHVPAFALLQMQTASAGWPPRAMG